MSPVAATSQQASAAQIQDLDSIFRLAALSGPEGAAWVGEFLAPEACRSLSRSRRAIGLLRQGRIEAGRRQLDLLEAEMSGLHPDLLEVVQRALYSARAYQLYREDDLERADAALGLADEAVSRAIAKRPFLMGLANHSYDFCLQRARIARKSWRWDEMSRHIERGRGILDNRVPICRLADGKEIFVSSVDEFFRSISLDDTVAPQEVADLVDDERRRFLFEYAVRENYVLPGFVVPLP
ncbi:MAG: hypothetical protein AAF604_16515 [Acidobacteriota bacterium]